METTVRILSVCLILFSSSVSFSESKKGRRHGYYRPNVFSGQQAPGGKSKIIRKKSTNSVLDRIRSKQKSSTQASKPITDKFAVKFRNRNDGRKTPKKTDYENETKNSIQKNRVTKGSGTAPSGGGGSGSGDDPFALEVEGTDINETPPGLEYEITQGGDGQYVMTFTKSGVSYPVTPIPAGEVRELAEQAVNTADRNVSLGQAFPNALDEIEGWELPAATSLRSLGVTDMSYYYPATNQLEGQIRSTGDGDVKKILGIKGSMISGG